MKKHVFPFAVLATFLLPIPVVAQQQTKPQSNKTSSSTPAAGTQQSQAPATAIPSGATAAAAQTPGAKPPTPGNPPGTALMDVNRATTPHVVPVDAGYVIGPQDVLDIDVWQEREFSRAVPVRPDGKITLPLLNDIQAAGLTPLQLGAAITTMLKKYVTDPQVTVIVAQINSRLVYLSGEVNKPGALPLLSNMTVLQALTLVGGPNQFANPKKIYILRTENGKQVRYPFNYKDAIRGKTTKENIVLQPGDTIVVP